MSKGSIRRFYSYADLGRQLMQMQMELNCSASSKIVAINFLFFLLRRQNICLNGAPEWLYFQLAERELS